MPPLLVFLLISYQLNEPFAHQRHQPCLRARFCYLGGLSPAVYDVAENVSKPSKPSQSSERDAGISSVKEQVADIKRMNSEAVNAFEQENFKQVGLKLR